MNTDNAIILIEKLVSTIAKAFYNDTYAIFLQELFYEKFIVEEEIGPRLKLSSKDVRKICTQLENEMLIQYEFVNVDETKSILKCYYINHQLFANVVRYRIHCMQNIIKVEEKTELNEIYFECPTCHCKFNSLEVQKFRASDYKFICTSCCPIENFRIHPSEVYYRLIEVDNRNKLSNLEKLGNKMSEQMNKSKYHDGIFDLLYKLKFFNLSTNLPSINIKSGIRTSMITDERINKEIKQNFEYATGQYSSSLIKKSNNNDLLTSNKIEIKVNIQTEENISNDNNIYNSINSNMQIINNSSINTASISHIKDDLNASLPDFLRDSRVKGANEIIKAVEILQQNRMNKSTLIDNNNNNNNEYIDKDMIENPLKRIKTDHDDNVVIDNNNNINVETIIDDDLDDVVWEDNEDNDDEIEEEDNNNNEDS